MQKTNPFHSLLSPARLDDFFRNVSRKIHESHERQAAVNRDHATSFNVFRLIDPNENTLSDVLADLLSPLGSHGQQDAFLRLFLAALELSPALLESPVRVKREATTHGIANFRRRIDILIESPTLLLAIENKIDALEQPDQINDYLSHLEACAGDGCTSILIYLTPDGRKPTSLSSANGAHLQSSKAFHCWSYPSHIKNWLTACHAACQAPKFQFFLQDFIHYIDNQLTRHRGSEEDHDAP